MNAVVSLTREQWLAPQQENAMKIYVIRAGNTIVRFVRAENKHKALRHCDFSAKVATQDELVNWLVNENAIEQAGEKRGASIGELAMTLGEIE